MNRDEELLPRDEIRRLLGDLHEVTGLCVTFSECGDGYSEPHDRRCSACRAELWHRTRERDGVCVCRCQRGLLFVSAPIRTKERFVGFLESEGFVSEPEGLPLAEPLTAEPLCSLGAEEHPFLPRERAAEAVVLLRIAAGYISELLCRREAEQLRAQAEFRALQSQIRPHFLFNTLNSISQMALLEGAEQAPEAIYSLAGILRRTMKQNTHRVSLEDELRLVSDFVRIKQLTGRVVLRYEEETEPGLKRMLLPPLCIQPLVENAITHGLEAGGQGGCVSFTAHRDDAFVMLSVTDDGAGFDPEALRAEEGGELSGIGFSNVTGRLKSYFGAGFRYEVFSAPGQGTTVSLYIPREKAGV